MKLKNKSKFLLVFGIIFVAFLLFNTNVVNAKEYTEFEIDDSITLGEPILKEEIEGITLTKTIADGYGKDDINYNVNVDKEIFEKNYENGYYDKFKDSNGNITIKVYVEIPSYIDWIYYGTGSKMSDGKIEKINGKNYMEREVIIRHNNLSFEEDFSNKITNDKEVYYLFVSEEWDRIVEVCKRRSSAIVFNRVIIDNTQTSTIAKGNIYKAETHEELNEKMGINGEWYEFADRDKYDINTYYTISDGSPRYILDLKLTDKNGLNLTENINIEQMVGIKGVYEEDIVAKKQDIYLNFSIIYWDGKERVSVDLGDKVVVEELGTFVRNEKSESNISGTSYWYQMKITDTSIFNNKYIAFELDVKTSGMKKFVTAMYQTSIADEVKENDNADKKDENTTIKNEDTNIKLDANIAVIPSNTILNAIEIKSEKILNVIKETLKEISNKYTSYDINLLSDGVKIQPNGNVKISIPIPNDYNKSKLAVYRIADDGTKIKYEVKVEGEYATFETDHFSTYVLAENNLVEDTTDKTTTNKGEKDDTPKTGTIDIIGYVLTATVLSGIGIVTLKKKLN